MEGEPIVIKKHPIVIIKNLVALEFAVALVYFFAGILANYGELYGSFSFSQTISYEIAKFSFIIIGEMALMGFIFLRWLFDTATVYPDAVTTERGVVFKRRKTYPLRHPLNITYRVSAISSLFKYGILTIASAATEKPVSIHHVPSPHTYVPLITKRLSGYTPIPEGGESVLVERLMKEREHEKLEFKASLRYDLREGRVNRVMEKAVMKTIAAFLNTDGGHLLLGVGDGGSVVGLSHDYQTLQRQDSDGFENHFTNIFRDAIGSEFRRFVKLSFHSIDDQHICLVQVAPAPKPAYLEHEGNEAFYIRTGNSTTELTLSKATAYIRSHWQEG